MESVNQILENNPIIFESNYIYPNSLNTTSINFKKFDLLTSHDDIHEFTENSINFIRYCKNQCNIEENEILTFYKNIKNINPDLLFNFVFL